MAIARRQSVTETEFRRARTPTDRQTHTRELDGVSILGWTLIVPSLFPCLVPLLSFVCSFIPWVGPLSVVLGEAWPLCVCVCVCVQVPSYHVMSCRVMEWDVA